MVESTTITPLIRVAKKKKATSQLAFRVDEIEKKLVKRTARKEKCTVSDILRTAWQYFAEKHNLYS